MTRLNHCVLALALAILSASGLAVKAGPTGSMQLDTVSVQSPMVALDAMMGSSMASKMCRPQTMMCVLGTHYVCDTCVPDNKCVPQKIMCPANSHYVCNTCVPNKLCVPQHIMCKTGSHYVCNTCVKKKRH